MFPIYLLFKYFFLFCMATIVVFFQGGWPLSFIIIFLGWGHHHIYYLLCIVFFWGGATIKNMFSLIGFTLFLFFVWVVSHYLLFIFLLRGTIIFY